MRRQKMGERGQALLLITLSLVAVLGLLGLVVDIGLSRYRRQAAQAAADSAALAAVSAALQTSGGTIACGSNNVVCQTGYTCPSPLPAAGSITHNLQNGCIYAAQNGFAVSDGGRQNVVLSSGTSGAPGGLAVPYWVTATVTESTPLTFSVILGKSTTTVAAAATAAALPGGGGGCIYILAANSTSVSMSGTSSIQSDCGIYVNSDSSAAMLLSGNPTIKVTGGSTTKIVGWYTFSGSPILSPPPQRASQASPDPFSGLQMPAPSGTCADAGGPITMSGSQSRTLDPGTYCNTIAMSGSCSLTLTSGLYILKGGISMSGSSTITGSEVTLYTYSGSTSMSGSGGIDITAPSSGTYKGIAFMQNRSDSSAATLSGGSNMNITGAVYLPAASLTYSGGSGTSGGSKTGLVVKGVTFSGSSYIKGGAQNGLPGGGGGIALIQ